MRVCKSAITDTNGARLSFSLPVRFCIIASSDKHHKSSAPRCHNQSDLGDVLLLLCWYLALKGFVKKSCQGCAFPFQLLVCNRRRIASSNPILRWTIMSLLFPLRLYDVACTIVLSSWMKLAWQSIKLRIMHKGNSERLTCRQYYRVRFKDNFSLSFMVILFCRDCLKA
jgi:hypothetical protein